MIHFPQFLAARVQVSSSSDPRALSDAASFEVTGDAIPVVSHSRTGRSDAKTALQL